eukprot:TRINITY_DN7174_c0_g1_i2.p1 TRINITY_DN7174_c0_g1~~TRINITY_DN7174_c0_g1_i2.p1  ORF type:complete len:122 (+),score=30.64 TRINITY_DN7174_c0_g1_i2:65-430(+)
MCIRDRVSTQSTWGFLTERVSINDTMGQNIQPYLPKGNRYTHVLGSVNGVYGFKAFSNSKNITEYGRKLWFADKLLDLPVTQENIEKYKLFRPLLRVKTRHVYTTLAGLATYGLFLSLIHI